ncbi:MAG: HAD-IC family P-type ATPase, partial [Anaerolineae bacterium]|nr:HAD-IC family P-type ATPase [Anaerolineae bacterium]
LYESLHGLTSAQVLEQRRKHGPNVLPSTKPPSPWAIFFAQLKNPLVYIILLAAAVSLLVGELGDFAIIMAVVVIDAILGFIQEVRAQQTYTALKTLLKPATTVIRDGTRQEIQVHELVPHDLVVLNAGERVPGDGQIIQYTKLTVDEAILTGESEPVVKSTAPDQDQMYMGTTVVTGRGLMRVTSTGSHTELGQIATSLHQDKQEETPLQIRLQAFSRTLTRLVLLITAAILIVGLLSGRPFLEMLRVSI